jgi:hypothetical protein
LKKIKPKFLLNYLQQRDPSYLRNIPTEIFEPPAPVIIYLTKLPEILVEFCSNKGIKPDELKGNNRNRPEKKIFIAVVLRLYNPELLTGIHSDRMKDNLRKELSGILEWNEECVSQVVNDIRTFLNPTKTFKAYEGFRNEVNEAYEHIVSVFVPVTPVYNLFEVTKVKVL